MTTPSKINRYMRSLKKGDVVAIAGSRPNDMSTGLVTRATKVEVTVSAGGYSYRFQTSDGACENNGWTITNEEIETDRENVALIARRLRDAADAIVAGHRIGLSHEALSDLSGALQTIEIIVRFGSFETLLQLKLDQDAAAG